MNPSLTTSDWQTACRLLRAAGHNDFVDVIEQRQARADAARKIFTQPDQHNALFDKYGCICDACLSKRRIDFGSPNDEQAEG